MEMNFDMTYLQDLGQNAIQQIVQLISGYVPNLLAALAILIIGWLVALLVASLVGGLIKKTKIDSVLMNSLGEAEGRGNSIAGYTKGIVFYFILSFVLVAFFQSLGLTLLTEPLNQMLSQILAFAPRLLGALGLLIFAWLIATLVKTVLAKVLTSTNLYEKLDLGKSKADSSLLVSSLSETVYWMVFLLVLPAILDALGLTDIVGPVNKMFEGFLVYIPNIFSAALILFVGWFLARIAKRIVTNLLSGMGIDQLLKTVGLGDVLGKGSLSEVFGIIVYVFILFPVLISALDSLQLNTIVEPATNVLNSIFSVVPMVLAALVMLFIAVIVGRFAAQLVTNLLHSVGFDNLLASLGVKPEAAKTTPSTLVGNLALVAVILFASIEAFNMLQLFTISSLLEQFVVFGGQILLGIIIFGIGIVVANLARKAITSTSGGHSTLATIAKVGILILAGAMGLREMGFANEIINLAFAILFGAIGVAIALSFGLGCKEIAAREFEQWLKSIKD